MALVAEEQSEIRALKARVAVLEEQVACVEEDSVEKVIVLREITVDEARSEIIDLFATGETLTTPTSPRVCGSIWNWSWTSAKSSSKKGR